MSREMERRRGPESAGVTVSPQRYERIGELPIWLGVVGGPIIWGLHLGVGSVLVTLPCIVDVSVSRTVLYVVTAIAAAGAAVCMISAAWAWRRSGLGLRDDWGEAGGRKGFMAVLGVMFSSISLLAIVMQSFGLPYASYCE